MSIWVVSLLLRVEKFRKQMHMNLGKAGKGRRDPLEMLICDFSSASAYDLYIFLLVFTNVNIKCKIMYLLSLCDLV